RPTGPRLGSWSSPCVSSLLPYFATDWVMLLPPAPPRHARTWCGHPRLPFHRSKTWMAGTSPALTRLDRAPSSLLDVGRDFLLLEVGGEIFLDRDVDEGGPDRRMRGIGVEMLMLDAAGLHRQQHQIALLPVLALALDDRIALALEDIDDEAALVTMLAG